MLALLASPGRAASDEVPPAELALTGAAELPFSETELQQALLARVLSAGEGSGQPRTRVDRVSPGVVAVLVGDRTQVVALGERTGVSAARVVALVIAELLAARQTVGTAERAPAVAAGRVDSPVPVAATAVPAPPSVAPAPLSVAPAPGAPSRFTKFSVAVTGGASRGTGSQERLVGTLNADVSIGGGRRWRLVPSVGLIGMPTENARRLDEVSFLAGTLRVLAGGVWGPVDLLAGPFFEVYRIGGATEHSGTLVGGELVARVTAPLSARLRLVTGLRLDAYINRVRVHWVGGDAFATPRVGGAVDLGLQWDWPS